MALKDDTKVNDGDADAEATRAISKAKGPRGRKGADKQEAALDNTQLRELSQELVLLKKSADDAAQDYGDAIKAAAEKTGYHASTIRSAIAALAGDNFEDKKSKVEQLSLAFEALA